MLHVMEALRADLVDLDGRIRNGDGWVGDEHELFQSVYERWSHAAGNVGQVLDSVAVLIGKSDAAVSKFQASVMEALGG